jgi:hypothetical protein
MLCRRGCSVRGVGEAQQTERDGHSGNENMTPFKHDALLFDAN